MASALEASELIVIRQVRGIDPARDLDGTVDIVVENGRITRIGRDAASAEMLKAEGARIIEGAGRWACPAYIDIHAHFREPGHEYKEDIRSGLRAAAAGGFGHVAVMPNTKPVNDTRGITEMMVSRARSVGGAHLHVIGAITKGLKGQELTEMADLREGGAVAVSDDGRCVTDSALMRRALEYARTFDLPVIQHAEDHALTEGAQMHEGAISTRLGLRGWPRVAEDIIVSRDILLAEATGARYHVAHISTEGAIRMVREAKSRGLRVTAEVTPHHLMLTDEAVLGYDTLCKVNPPLREQRDVDACRAGLADGTIDAIATDHAPHSSLEKDCEFQSASPGLIGLELVVPVLLELVRDGKLPLDRFVDALTQAPAKVIGITSPVLAESATADIVLVSPETQHHVDASTLASKCDNSPFVGRDYQGAVDLTMVDGKIVFERETSKEEQA